ncbi:MAG: DUF2243 domain-containing protein [Mesorhizobium sp.]|nr:DUF2243 domain-containing protein [Mesorhizobium sp. M2A.F.Ca.ET.046.03.2.1]RUY13349.1 DUF2243 domain-containing protein [Mesorhizobium sp. M2A.F.Ca.ET.040.01.1.1]RVC71225.1 DUF2243 domain-containing protein [Mesorhizobium sp. M00.F.Ca.ET.038.03.1.1]RVC76057.1 DUF2243 domain-containing protein [Mesorhizobium sp. M2A.F.Ca.ET.046.02.1.1]RWA92945.1 MAG: DUF2243 domain-containing protein [Mesorhizobium sp.]RWX72251.1 DUF2243 domain-containing protein [Mesorhizobium sp. M2A.F.Ca.ET.039.01.1.1]
MSVHDAVNRSRHDVNRQALCGWLLVGFALAGFFDGIVLHQILQWHHLLSAFSPGSDLRFQVMSDGLFHLVMYLLLVLASILLVAARATNSRVVTTSEILRLSLVGFGMWHVADAVVFHWLLGLHRIKINSDAPLAWDIGWLVIFGLLPLLLAWAFPSRSGAASGGMGAALMSIVLLSGLAAAVGPSFTRNSEVIVVFQKGMNPASMMQAILRAGTSTRWNSSDGSIWVVGPVSWGGLFSLHANGALVVSTSPLVGGCLAWSSFKV